MCRPSFSDTLSDDWFQRRSQGTIDKILDVLSIYQDLPVVPAFTAMVQYTTTC